MEGCSLLSSWPTQTRILGASLLCVCMRLICLKLSALCSAFKGATAVCSPPHVPSTSWWASPAKGASPSPSALGPFQPKPKTFLGTTHLLLCHQALNYKHLPLCPPPISEMPGLLRLLLDWAELCWFKVGGGGGAESSWASSVAFWGFRHSEGQS